MRTVEDAPVTLRTIGADRVRRTRPENAADTRSVVVAGASS